MAIFGKNVLAVVAYHFDFFFCPLFLRETFTCFTTFDFLLLWLHLYIMLLLEGIWDPYCVCMGSIDFILPPLAHKEDKNHYVAGEVMSSYMSVGLLAG